MRPLPLLALLLWALPPANRAPAAEPTPGISNPPPGGRVETNGPASSVGAGGSVKARIYQALTEKQPVKRLEKLSDIGANLSLSEITPALELATGLKQLRERAVLQEAALRRWSDLAPTNAFAYVAKWPESRLKVELTRVAAVKFARHDAARAAAAAAALNAGRSRYEAIDAVAGVWAETNVTRALQWAEKLPDGFAKESALNAIRFAWSRSDPVAASSQVQKLPAGDAKNSLITNVAAEWAALDPQAAIRWANSLPDGPEKELALASVAESWADQEPPAAAAFALKLAPAELRQRAAAAVVSRWATQDPRQAVEWALQTGDADIQKRGTEEALNLWAAFNPVECGKWLESQPPGPGRDPAIRAYVAGVVAWAPEAAARQALLIENEIARFQALDESVPRWLELDPVSARSWLKEAELPEVMKTRWVRGASAQ